MLNIFFLKKIIEERNLFISLQNVYSNKYVWLETNIIEKTIILTRMSLNNIKMKIIFLNNFPCFTF